MGLKIFTLAKVLKWVKEIERRRRYYSPAKIKNNGMDNSFFGNTSVENINEFEIEQSLPSLSHFKADTSIRGDEELMIPFIKVEDKERVYEPQYLELSSVPSLCFDSKVPRSPFQKLHLNGTVESIGNNSEFASNDVCKHSNKTFSSTSKYSQSGWCDFCESFYRLRDRHIRSKKHQTNIPLECYHKLDELITSSGSFKDFVRSAEETRKKARAQKRKVVDVVLKRLDGTKRTCDFLRNSRVELNEIVNECNVKRRKSRFTNSNGRNVIR